MTPILASIAGIAVVFVLLRMAFPDMFSESDESFFDLFGDGSDSSGDGGDASSD